MFVSEEMIDIKMALGTISFGVNVVSSESIFRIISATVCIFLSIIRVLLFLRTGRG